MRLLNKVVLITGAARGIGKAIAIGLALEGARIMLADIDLEEAEAVAAAISKNQGQAEAFRLDVSNKVNVEKAVDLILAKEGRIDVLVNNAGVAGVTAFVDTNDDEWNRIMDINLKGVYYCCKAVVPSMIKQHTGKIINISSVAAKVGGGLLGTSTYAASKAGVIGLSKGLARELAPFGIYVNVIAPGSITTDITRKYLTAEQQADSIKRIPVGRRGNPEDVAGVAVLLASAESDFITGATIDVNGGLRMD
jgi:3-oxoacyl-[acyl-carrier protein] reductase